VKFVYCAGEIASIVINFSPEGLTAHKALMAHTSTPVGLMAHKALKAHTSTRGLMAHRALKAHTFPRGLARSCWPSQASGENSLWEIRCIRIHLRGIPEAVAVSNLFL
jgi:hypothetical protein